jgi:acetyl esterase/lipase
MRTTHRDLSYAAETGRGHLLDLYLPAGDGPFPVVIYQGGSAFRSDDTKSDAAPIAKMWLPRGYAIVGLNVRSSSQATFPAQVHDVKAAIRYLRAHAGKYGLDGSRFATMGTSSGGWVVAMAAVTAEVAELEGDLGNPEQSSAVQAVVDLFGPTNFLEMDTHRLPDGMEHDPPDSPESQLMGFAIQTDPVAVHAADPSRYVTAASPPAWISHGMQDPLVPYHQSELLFAAYERAGAPATLTLVRDAGHTDRYLASAAESAERTVQRTSGGATTTEAEPPPTYETVLAFLDETFR